MSAPLPTVIVLAAGRSERFAAASGGQHKLQALLGTRSVREHTLEAVRASGLPWHVVEATHTAHLRLPGMGDSIATLILPADLPLVQPQTLRTVAQALQSHTVVVPVFASQRGHPVGFAATCGPALMALTGDQGARAVLQAHAPYALAVDDAGCIHDVDTPEALEAALRVIHGAQDRR
ncbi:MAG: nucleotidyltransferase family protein [Betaproteobacteria bacterium]|nr:nucleotidyltransferase family protein [Betaproteobacteria bacterium]